MYKVQIIFWTFLLIIIYAYLIYPAIICILSKLAKLFRKNQKKSDNNYEPEVTILVAAFNEIDFIDQKVENSFLLNYPKEKIHHIWITDGSDDGTLEALQKQEGIEVYHQKERNGKTGAINRGISFVKTPIVIFSDANSMLNKDAIIRIVDHFKNSNVGCVAGEKRIENKDKENAANAGEGIYWNYESFIKKCESDINSAIGAVGELFAIRTELYEQLESDTILDDFIISLRIALKGFKIKYEPDAIATEGSSISIKEELKRKTRIAYGGFQSIGRLKRLLNPFKFPVLTFQYFSHKILRWLFVPFSFLFVFISNILLVCFHGWTGIYTFLFLLQLLFYLLVIIGALFQKSKTNFKLFFAPYYLFIMNLSEIIGLIRFIQKKQSVNWERAKRE